MSGYQGSDAEYASLPMKPSLGAVDEDTPLILPDRGQGLSPGSASRDWSVSVTKSLRQLRSASMNISLIAVDSNDRNASAWLAGWNVTNLIQGTGILGVPYAVQQGGWAAVVAIVVVAMICCYTGKLLVECLYEESPRSKLTKRVRTNYPEVGEAVWPGFGHKVVSVVQVCEMFGGAIMYIVLLSTIFSQILKDVSPLDQYQWAVVCVCVAFPSIFVTRVSIIAWFSLVAVIALMASILTIIAYCITQYEDMDINKIPVFDMKTFPVGFGIIVFSYCAHAVFPGVEASMKEPKKFPKMMNAAFILAATVKTAMGLMAVLRFGKATDQVVTVNMQENFGFSISVTIMVVTNVFLAFPLVMFVVLETWDHALLHHFPSMQEDCKFHWVWLVISRAILIIFGLLLAIVVPHFGLLMGLVGSFTGTCLSFVFPCLFHLKLKWHRSSWLRIFLNSFIILFGLIAGSMGLFFSGKALADAYKENGI